MSHPKEPNFFSDDDPYARGIGHYQALFKAGEACALRGESSTHYTKLPTYPRTVERMQRVLPSVKLVYLMRHPIDRLVSQYAHDRSTGKIAVSLHAALDRHPELVDYSLYHMQLTPYLAAFGKAAILPVFVERLQSNAQAELERICVFLGYPGKPHWRDDGPRPSVPSERPRLGAWGRALLDQPHLAELRRQFVPKRFREALKQGLTRERPVLAVGTRTALAACFDADLAQLGKLLGEPSLCSHRYKEQVTERRLDWATQAERARARR
jgi:hypothetical protein